MWNRTNTFLLDIPSLVALENLFSEAEFKHWTGILIDWLAHLGYTVPPPGSVEEAIRIFPEQAFDVVVIRVLRRVDDLNDCFPEQLDALKKFRSESSTGAQEQHQRGDSGRVSSQEGKQRQESDAERRSDYKGKTHQEKGERSPTYSDTVSDAGSDIDSDTASEPIKYNRIPQYE